jgi:lysyl oxidase-like protein 2/3/4
MTTPMVLSGVECRGNEETLDSCLHHQLNEVDCPGQSENIAAVVCTQGISFGPALATKTLL